MCDNYYNNVYWQNSFYHQYMQQHSAMMQWIQSLHSNVNVQNVHGGNQTYGCSSYCPQAIQYDSKPEECNLSYESGSSSSENYSSSCTSGSTDSGKKGHAETYEDDETESDYEFELNVDAILAMRQAKEDLKKDSSSDGSSIVMIDNVKEEFEFVELGSVREMGTKKSIMVGGFRDRNAELQYEKEFKENLYGEKSTTIAGLETAMSLTYERLCDIHQPPVWPVYPLRLTSCAKK